MKITKLISSAKLLERSTNYFKVVRHYCCPPGQEENVDSGKEQNVDSGRVSHYLIYK